MERPDVKRDAVKLLDAPVGLIRFRGQFDYAACFSR